jgi:hypothetical protein
VLAARIELSRYGFATKKRDGQQQNWRRNIDSKDEPEN